MADDQLNETRRVLEQGMVDGLHIGAQMFVSRAGRMMADLAMGEARPGVPMRTDTLMLWLSAVKPVGAVAVAQLFERGELNFDDRVTRFIPEFCQGGKEAITLKHLLTHTGGFRNAECCDDGREWEAIIECICGTRLEPGWVPGEKAGYHISVSWFILAEIIRRIDGRTYDRFVREEVFEPLGMNDSWVGMPMEEVVRYGDRLGVMQVTERDKPALFSTDRSAEDFALCRPASRGRGPIRELGRFYEMLLNGGRFGDVQLLKPDSVRLLTRRQRVNMFDRTFQHKLDWGLGFIVNSNRHGVETVPYGFGRHSSDAAFGHGGSQSSCAFADPEHQLVVAWVCNGRPGERRHQKRARAINEAIYSDLGLANAGQA